MCIIYITRFSLVVTNMLTSTRRSSYDEYLEFLFSDARMNTRFELFENITLPSIVNQVDLKNVYWFICISDKLPSRHLNRLNDIIKPYNFIKTVTVGDNENLNNKIKSTRLFQSYKNKIKATVRLDDDDALTRFHTKNVKKYMKPKYLNHILGFKTGIFYNYNLNRCRFHFGRAGTWIPAVGCCYYSLDNTIYGCGDHSKYTNKYKCIIDYKTPCWVITDSNFGDENRFGSKYNNSTKLIKRFFPHIKIK